MRRSSRPAKGTQKLDADVLEAYIYKNASSRSDVRKVKRALQKIMAVQR